MTNPVLYIIDLEGINSSMTIPIDALTNPSTSTSTTLSTSSMSSATVVSVSTTAATPGTTSSSSDQGLSSGAKGGIIGGVVGGVIVLSVFGFLCFRFRSTGDKRKVPRVRVNIPPDSEEGREVINSGNLVILLHHRRCQLLQGKVNLIKGGGGDFGDGNMIYEILEVYVGETLDLLEQHVDVISKNNLVQLIITTPYLNLGGRSDPNCRRTKTRSTNQATKEEVLG